MNTDALTGKAINRAHAIDELLRKHYPAAKGRSLHTVLKSLADTLPAVLARTITVVANVRDAAAHPGGSKPFTLPPDFDRLCDEIELLIPYFADRQRAKPDQAPNKTQAISPKAADKRCPLEASEQRHSGQSSRQSRQALDA